MTGNKNHLFNQKLLIEKYRKIEIDDDSLKELTEKVFNLPEESITMGKKTGNEENVKNKVVVQLLKFLGFDEQLDLDYEVSTLRKAIDVAIKIDKDDKKPKALVEVKYWKKDLDKLRKESKYKSDVQQGLIYALESGIEWVIITNGFEWRLYRTFISGQIVYNFYEEFTLDSLKEKNELKKFYLLCSKESFKKDILNKLFSETELLKKKINEDIFDILVNCRSKLFLDIFENNKGIDEKAIMEMGQKILDRLVFIRFAEDNNLFSNSPLLKSLNSWKGLPKNMKDRNPLYNFLFDLFSYIREGNEEDDIYGYDGELFEKDDSLENLTIKNEVLNEVIDKLYKYPDDKYIDFAEIPIDILGHIYEKYLALSLNIKEEGSKVFLEEKSTKKIRKKTGIYYTPKYIVHFILEKTIMSLLNRDINILPDLKIVDPACGSGAFLSQAYDLLYVKYGEYNEIISTKSTKANNRFIDMKRYAEVLRDYKSDFDKKILKNNLFGVDINPESVEITKMSLWFKTAQKNIPLNKLEANIKCGDSLIDNPELSSEKAFNWEKNFSNIFKQGGFDLIIGNPPYFKIKKDSPLTKLSEYNEIKMAFVNAAALFLNRMFNLLKDKGILGFIVPKQISFTSSWKLLRKKIFDNFKILFLIDCGKAFEKVLLEQVIIILEKDSNNSDNVITLGKAINDQIVINGEVNQDLCKKEDLIFLQYNQLINIIKEKCEVNSILLKDISKMQIGLGIQKLKKSGVFTERKTKDSLVVLSGNDIQRYHLRDCLYFNENHKDLEKYQSRIINPPIKKIVAQRIVAHIRDHIKITATVEEISSLSFNTVLEVFPKDKNDTLYILGLMNSDLISYYLYKFVYNNAIRSMDFYPAYASRMPIFKASNSQKKEIAEIVKKLMDNSQKSLDYNKNIQKIYLKYSGVNKTKLSEIISKNFHKLLIKKDKRIKVRSVDVVLDDDVLILRVNGKDILKIQITDNNKRKYLHYFLDSLNIDSINEQDKKVFESIKCVEIDDFDDDNAIKTVVNDLNFQTKNELKNEMDKLENQLNEKIYNLFSLNESEINYIKKSYY